MSGGAIAGAALGIVSDQISGARQSNENRKSQNRQLDNQMQLNEQGQALGLDTWNKTNYEAQMKHIKNAGLNPALIYGQSGNGGGTVASPSGGSASATQATAQNSAVQGAGLGLQMELLKAQKDNIEADTENKRAENPVKGADVALKGADTALKTQQTKDYEESVKGKQIQNEINSLSKQDQIDYLKWKSERELANSQGDTVRTNVQINTQGTQIDQAKAELHQTELHNAILKETQGMPTMQKIEIQAKVNKMAQDIQQGWQGLSQEQQRIRIDAFAKELQSEYPNVMNVGGKLINEVVNGLVKITEDVSGKKAGNNYRKIK